MWANQDWSDIQPAKRNTPHATQFVGAIDGPTFERMTSYWIQNYLLVSAWPGPAGQCPWVGVVLPHSPPRPHPKHRTALQLPNYYLVPDLKTASPARVCALINVYLVSTLIDGLGGLEAASAAMASFRAAAAAAGMPCIHLQAEGFGLKQYGAQMPAVIAGLGIDSVTDYCWQHYQGSE
jgi:hypothetical protein